MVGSAGTNVRIRAGVQAPPPPGQQAMKAAPGVAAPSIGHQAAATTAAAAGNQTSPKIPSPANQSADQVLHQTRKLPYSPIKMAMGGFVVVLSLAYFTLYTEKKPEATAVDVARVATGTSAPHNTRPRS